MNAKRIVAGAVAIVLATAAYRYANAFAARRLFATGDRASAEASRAEREGRVAESDHYRRVAQIAYRMAWQRFDRGWPFVDPAEGEHAEARHGR